MTKKTQEVLKKYEQKLNSQLWLYENEMVSFDECTSELERIEKEFEEFKTQMFYYGVISKNDFNELTHIPFTLRIEYYDKVLAIKI